MICQNHDGKQCFNEGKEWNIRTLATQQILHVILCNDHIRGEDYSEEFFFERISDKTRLQIKDAYNLDPAILARDYVLERI